MPRPVPLFGEVKWDYVCLEEDVQLPATIHFDATANSKESEFLPCFSQTRAEWDIPDRDALCWFLSAHRSDLTFRTELFSKLP